MACSRGKWTQHKILIGSRGFAASLPTTRPMMKKFFWSLLDKYRNVVIKPSRGSGGKGVIQVSLAGKEKYTVHYGKTIKTIIRRKSAYSFVRGKTKSASHIIQQKIPLAKIRGRPFDIRVMLQRTRKSNWVITGKLAKIAGPGYIITNIARSKGRVVPVSTAIQRSMITGISVNRVQNRIDRIARKAVRRLQSYYRINIVGLDIGLDSRGKVWLIEANFSPSKSLFLHLKDKSSYRRIISYSRKRKSPSRKTR